VVTRCVCVCVCAELTATGHHTQQGGSGAAGRRAKEEKNTATFRRSFPNNANNAL
jgi:hypothetical protein